MAAPHVSGFAALLMQQGITSPPAVEAAMEQFATDLGPSGRDEQYGFGLINPRASLRGARAGEVTRVAIAALALLLLVPSASRAQISFRGFGDIGLTVFSATQSFKAILGKPSGPVFGGGVEFGEKQFFLSLGAQRFRHAGHRVFVFDNQVFPLDVSDTITVTPLELTAGYRFRSSGRFIPTRASAAAGSSSRRRPRIPPRRTMSTRRTPGITCSAASRCRCGDGWLRVLTRSGRRSRTRSVIRHRASPAFTTSTTSAGLPSAPDRRRPVTPRLRVESVRRSGQARPTVRGTGEFRSRVLSAVRRIPPGAWRPTVISRRLLAARGRRARSATSCAPAVSRASRVIV